MKVSISQFKSTASIPDNLEVIKRHISDAAESGARLIVFPEASMIAYETSGQELVAITRDSTAPFVQAVCDEALRHAIHVFIGIYEPYDDMRTKNTILHIDDVGVVQGRYEKIHLYDAFSFVESEKNKPGDLLAEHAEVYVAAIDGIQFGILNCYDLRFPEISRIAVDKGADVLVYSAGWIAGSLKEMHWETLLKARAIENTCFAVASCQPPPTSVGMSMLIDPSGLVVAGMAEQTGVVTAEIGMHRLAEVRKHLPCLEHRRYAIAAWKKGEE
ncbi:MAG: carbon-nitrogen hydrolase family protein [Burkholderiaceae bacterium]|nr:carbon-nitrogen hydrolase family protein [Burkholderiaceae bacterium]